MYKGKFDAKAKGQQEPADTLENILKEREAAIAQRAARQAERARRSAGGTAAQRPTRPAAHQPEKAPRAAAENRAVKTEMQKVQAPKKSGSRIGSKIFYTLYFLCIFAFAIGMLFTLNWLNGWLVKYEKAQPEEAANQVFQQLFTNPDWGQLYRLSGTADTDFEGASEYVAYMENKVGTQALEMSETSAGISKDFTMQRKKYIIHLDGERLATFTLEGKGASVIDIPDWKLSGVELLIKRDQSIKIKKLEDHVAYVNGVPLDDSYTIQIASTKADEYLPTGSNKVRTSIQMLDGLMAPPQVVVYDQSGTNRVGVQYNPESGMYEEQNEAIVMSEEERGVVFGALESFAGFMINASGSRAGVAKYFDGSSQAYADIIKMGGELWMNTDRGHSFENEEILGYTKHSDSLFSVRASMVMVANGKDGTKLEFPVKESMFFTKKNGNWICYDMTNVDITEPVGQVKLTFRDSSGNVLSSEFYATNATSLTTPLVNVPAGKVFSGWSRIEEGENNVKTWTIVFRPDESGNVVLNGSLEPMTLYPLFENA